MYIRRGTFNSAKEQPRLQKALALAIFLKYKVGRQSIVKNFSVNKIRKITGLSPTTIKKYMPIILQQGWARFEGKNNQHLVMSRMASNTAARNICIDKFCFKSFKDVYNSVRAFLALLIQARKDFIKRTLQIVADPQKGENFYAARRNMKRLVRKDILRDVYATYKEWGLSYNRIANELGNCARTAFKVMQYAIKNKWTVKHNHFEQIFAPKILFYQPEGYTFSTRNNLYLVHANTYENLTGIFSL